ncbi:MAG: HAD family hydrolase [Candidatus Bathyarchaeota archaeon]|nr:HAD family hydrolase [Candidatus Bathyarchaeota archaeon]
MSKKSRSIKAVTFDLWETLLLEEDGFNARRTSARCRNLSRVLDNFGVKISVKQLALAIKELASWLAGVWRSNREVSHLNQIQFIIQTASHGETTLKSEWIEDLSSAYASALFEVQPYLNPEALGVVKWLQDQNKRMGLISNTGLTPGFGLRRFLEDKSIAKYFEFMIFSDEIGIRKPDPRIFQTAARRFQLSPRQIVHIGDNLKSDMWGAKNVKFKTIHFSCEVGRDRTAESDPASLASISRELNGLKVDRVVPHKTISSLAKAIDAIRELDS